MGDEPRGDGEDVAARTVVALEPDHPRAGKVFFEAEDVVDVRPAPAVDRLVVVADAADVAAALRQETQPQVLDGVGVLVLVDQNVAEAALKAGEHVGVLAEKPQRFEQQIAEIDRVQRFQPRLIGGVERRAAPGGECRRFRWGNVLRIDAAVLPAVDGARQRPGRPALVVEVLRLQNLLQEPQLIVRIEDGEVRPKADEFGVHAQDFHADRMERAEPGHALMGAGEDADPLAHLARRLVGEGDGQDLVRPRPSRGDQMGDPGRQHPRLADAGAGKHEHRPVERLDRCELLGVEPSQVRRKRPGRPCGSGGGKASASGSSEG